MKQLKIKMDKLKRKKAAKTFVQIPLTLKIGGIYRQKKTRFLGSFSEN
jgi:hypothetical protein